jgi:hypothetical protein
VAAMGDELEGRLMVVAAKTNENKKKFSQD